MPLSTPLAEQHCSSYSSDSTALSAAEIEQLKSHLPDWYIHQVEGVSRLEREFTFSTFLEALDFTNKVGAMAEVEDHHPAILTEWGKVTVNWWTHFVGGLHLNDFIAAAKTDALLMD